MFGIGMGEFVLILIVGLIIFGPKNLPEVGKALGKGLREFRKAQAVLSATLEDVAAEPAKKSETKAAEVPFEKKFESAGVSTDDAINAARKTATAENPASMTVDDVINAAKENPIPQELYTGTVAESKPAEISLDKKSAAISTDDAVTATAENKNPAPMTVDDVINAAKENPIPQELYTGTVAESKPAEIPLNKKSAAISTNDAATAENKNPAPMTVDDVINAAKENPIPQELYTGTSAESKPAEISLEKKSAPVTNENKTA